VWPDLIAVRDLDAAETLFIVSSKTFTTLETMTNARAASGGVRGRDRRVPRRGPGTPRRLFQRLLTESPTPERCLEAYYLQRTRFETIAERKLRQRRLTADGNVEITGRDFRKGAAAQPSRFAGMAISGFRATSECAAKKNGRWIELP